MTEEHFVTGAEIIQSGLAVRRFYKSMLGALPITGKAHFALPAVARQRSLFRCAKLLLCAGCDHRGQR